MGRVLDVRDLRVQFRIEEKYYDAVRGVNFHLDEGETLGLVGESGCGKSVTSLAVMRLLRGATRVTGVVDYKGQNLVSISDRQMRKLRGSELAMIFQEPMTSLNPVHTIGRQLVEVLWIHHRIKGREAHSAVLQLLHQVGIPRAEGIVREYPHQLSGGMRQRIMIAMAMACNPTVLIADEPTTALDVTIQAQILDLMRHLTSSRNMSTLLITHDLGVVAEMCNRVAVMYAGQIVESGTVRQVFKNPQHPYTVGLLKSIPRLDGDRGRLHSIDGNVPSLRRMPQGCRFAPRCQHAMDICRSEDPPVTNIEPEHQARCWLHDDGKVGESVV